MEPNKNPQTNQSQDHRQKNNFRRGGGFRGQQPKEKSEFDSKMLALDRVARVTKGGKRFSFRATMVVGDGKGRVGVGVAQGHDVQQSMAKATAKAKKSIVRVPMVNASIPHQIQFKYHSAIVMLKPAPLGSGVKAGGPVRVIAKLAGISNITAKLIQRTGNKINIARATIEALKKLTSKENATTSTKANS